MELVKTLNLEVMEPLKQDVMGFHQGGVLTLVTGAVPHKPHASLTLKLDLGEGLCPAMTLPHSQRVEEAHKTQGSGPEEGAKVLLDKPFEGEWLYGTLPQDESTQLFAAVSHACSECVAPTCPSERGTSLKIVRKPLLQTTAPQTKRTAKCSWGRALTWLKAAKQGEDNRHSWQTVIEWIHNLPAVKGAEDPEQVKFQLAEFLATGSGDPQPLQDQVERFARLAKASKYEEDKAQYQAWLEEAQAGSMRPLSEQSKAMRRQRSGHSDKWNLACGPSSASSSGRRSGGPQIAPSRGSCSNLRKRSWRMLRT